MAAPPVEILFRVGGISDVKAAIGSVEASLDKMARSSVRSTQASTRRRVSDEERAARDIARQQEKAARERQKSADKEQREQQKRFKESEREHDRLLRTQARNEEKAQRERIRSTEKAERAIRSEHERTAREQERRARAGFTKYGGAAARGFGRATSAIGQAAGMIAAVGGGFAVADAVRVGMSNEATAGKIVRGAATGAEGVTSAQVLQDAAGTAIATGGRSADILAGLDQFMQKVGDLKAARDLMKDLAELSAATGASFEDMASTAAEVFSVTKDAPRTMQAMRDIAGMGRAGAVDVRQLGQYGSRLTAMASATAGDPLRNIRSAAAAAQLAKRYGGATDAAEATEAVAATAADMREHYKNFAGLGVNVYADKDGHKLRNLEDIIAETIQKSKGDLRKLGDVTGMRSIKAFLGAQVAYANAGGGERGMAALHKEFSDLGAATLTPQQVKQGVSSRLGETEAKVNAAAEAFDTAMRTRLLPVLPPLVEAFADLAQPLADVLKWISSDKWHALGTLGGMIVATVTGEIAKAAIGAAVKDAIVAAIGGRTATAAATNVAANLIGGGSGAVGVAGRVAAGLGVAGAGTIGLGLALGTGAAAFGSYEAEKDARARRLATPANAGEAAIRGSRDFAGLIAPRDAVGNVADPFAVPLKLGGVSGGVLNGASGGISMGAAAKGADALASSANGATAALDAFATRLGSSKADPTNPSRAPAP